MMNLTQKQLDRFWSYIDKKSDDECWEWTSYKRGNYGLFYLNGKSVSAHRLSWFLDNGPIPEFGSNGKRICVLHRCDNPPCINPHHLFIGTDKENSEDRDQKGRRVPFRPVGKLNGNATVSQSIVKKEEDLLKNGLKSVVIAGELGISEALVENIKYKRHWSQKTGLTYNKLYIIVRQDLSQSQQAVQAGHALAEYMLASSSPNWTNETLIYLGVKGLKQLENLKFKLENHGINYVEFKEPDIGNEITAIATDENSPIFEKLNLI